MIFPVGSFILLCSSHSHKTNTARIVEGFINLTPNTDFRAWNNSLGNFLLSYSFLNRVDSLDFARIFSCCGSNVTTLHPKHTWEKRYMLQNKHTLKVVNRNFEFSLPFLFSLSSLWTGLSIPTKGLFVLLVISLTLLLRFNAAMCYSLLCRL